MVSGLRMRQLAIGAMVGVVLLLSVQQYNSPSAREGDRAVTYGPGPIDIQNDGPLMDGQTVALEDAIELTDYPAFPIPPTNEVTGSLTNIWIDGLKQVAFVWSSDLRLYINPLLGMRQEELVAGWTVAAPFMKKAALTKVGEQVALGVDGSGAEEPSSLTWADPENGLILQFVSPVHTVDQLREVVSDFSYQVAS